VVFLPPVGMTPSAYKHGFDFEEALYVMANPVGQAVIRRTPEATEVAFVGYP
jgi:hypothetical protein